MSTGLIVRGADIRRGDRLVVKNADLEAPRGQVTGLIGPNGAGKSSLMAAMLGLAPLAGGEIAFDGLDLPGMPRRQRARLCAYVEQAAFTQERLSVRDVVLLGRIPHQSIWQAQPSARDEAAVDQALGSVALQGFAQRRFDALSGGEQQRVHLARALAQEPELLLLDEPTSHLDVSAQMLVLDVLTRHARQGATVVAALHDLNLAAQYCQNLVAMHDGRVVAQGKPEDVLSPALLRDIYRVDASVLRAPGDGRLIIAFDRIAPVAPPNPD